MNQFDFVAVGDVTADAFIRLGEGDVHKHVREVARELCVPFATKIPYEFVVEVYAVGNCANAAVAASRLGLSSALVSNQGDDEIGHKNFEVLKTEGVSREFVRMHKNQKSNYHYVLWYKDERTILVKHEAYPYDLPDIGNPKWLYLTSLSSTSLNFHKQISEFLKSHPTTKLAFQPGTFQIKLGTKELAYLYERSEVFFCNLEEAREILENKSGDVKKLLHELHVLGPKIVVITDGPKGAYCSEKATGHIWFMPPYPDLKAPYDRTGAGDAYGSTFTTALALGKNIREALLWAPVNAMSVVQFVGAREGLLTRQKIEQYLAAAPVTYKPQLIF